MADSSRGELSADEARVVMVAGGSESSLEGLEMLGASIFLNCCFVDVYFQESRSGTTPGWEVVMEGSFSPLRSG